MISKINRIHGSSSEVTFDCEGLRIKGRGEFFADDGGIAGFVVSKASLVFEDGRRLTSDEQDELVYQYERYVSQPHIQKYYSLKFE